MAQETETVVPYGARTIGEAVLALELWSRRVHSAQRLALFDRLSVPDRVSRLMRDVIRSLSSPDEDRDRAYARRANELLRNSAVKGHLASFLALEGQIEHLASITANQGEIDRTFSTRKPTRSTWRKSAAAKLGGNDEIQAVHQPFTPIWSGPS